jgi:membrane-bound lytic murein transglycosylase B
MIQFVTATLTWILVSTVALAALLSTTVVQAKSKTPAPRPKPALETYAHRVEVKQFAAEVSGKLALNEAWVLKVLAKTHKEPKVIALMTPPPPSVSTDAGQTPSVQTAKNWAAYRANALAPSRIQAGLQFWRQHEDKLLQAQARYGVPPEIVLGILGVETLYGQNMGRFRVIDALATLAFDFPASHPRAAERSAFFKAELAQFLALKNMPQHNLMKLKGSYAGAMGQPQFMPSSWARYGVDFDQDERIDLFASAGDVIGSVAHYLQAHGWTKDAPTHFVVEGVAGLPEKSRQTLLGPDIVPTFSAANFAQHGAVLEPAGAAFGGKLALVELKNAQETPTYFAGTPNFYVLTRYNWSAYYAMAVIELGQALSKSLQEARQVVSISKPS